MRLEENGLQILKYIVKKLREHKGSEDFFIGYKQVHDGLGWCLSAEKWGRSLDIQGLGNLCDWARENGHPAITGLVIEIEKMNPGGKFYKQNEREIDDFNFWFEQAKLAREYDWESIINDVEIGDVPKLTPDSINQANTYLLSWGTDKWEWDTFQKELHEFRMTGYLRRRWGCGLNKSIQSGDRVFLIKLGTKGAKCIFASGYAESSFFEDEHWDGTSGKLGKFINVFFDVLLDPEIDLEHVVSYVDLNSNPKLKGQEWSPRSSGVRINERAANELEKIWLNRLGLLGNRILSNVGNIEADLVEGRCWESIRKNYERNPIARKMCLEEYGYSCFVCDFNFEEVFGERGKDFIHVHHILPISKRGGEYKVDPIADLRPVCPNCHSMIHRGETEFSIDELKNILNTEKNELMS